MRIGELKAHPYADIFPWLPEDRRPAFRASIARRGIEEPIVLVDAPELGLCILDGRNRHRDGLAAGVLEPDADPLEDARFRMFGSRPGDGEDLFDFVRTHNFDGRRDLTDGQRVMIAAKLATLRPGRPSEWDSGLAAGAEGARPLAQDFNPANWPGLSHVEPGQGPKAKAPTQAEAAQLLSVSERQVRRGVQVIETGVPELVDAASRGDIAPSAAEQISKLPADEQRRIVQAADPKVFASVAKERRAETQQLKRERRDERARELAGRQRALPQGIKAGVIVADPAWPDPERYSDETGMDRAAENHYPTMDLAEIMDLDVSGLSAEDAVLFLWCKANNVDEALCVAAAWGYAGFGLDAKGRVVPMRHSVDVVGEAAAREGARTAPDGHPRYVSNLVWDKVHIGNGRWVRDRHEHLLIFRRGTPVPPAMGRQLASVFAEAKTRHSSKPEALLAWIETTWPDAVKLELNRRGAPRPGWHAWGNEASVSGAAGAEEARQHAEEQTLGDKLLQINPHSPQGEVAADAGEGGSLPSPDMNTPRGSGTAREAPGGQPLPGDGDIGDLKQKTLSAPHTTPKLTSAEINAIIREGYGRDAPLAELAERTGIRPDAVKQRARTMKLGSRARQRSAVAQSNRRRAGGANQTAGGTP